MQCCCDISCANTGLTTVECCLLKLLAHCVLQISDNTTNSIASNESCSSSKCYLLDKLSHSSIECVVRMRAHSLLVVTILLITSHILRFATGSTPVKHTTHVTQHNMQC
jgi:hypothetical protein